MYPIFLFFFGGVSSVSPICTTTNSPCLSMIRRHLVFFSQLNDIIDLQHHQVFAFFQRLGILTLVCSF